MTGRIQFDFPAIYDPSFARAPRTAGYGGWIAWIRTIARRYRERRLLEVLDDRSLCDIGISRSQALAEAAKPFWRR